MFIVSTRKTYMKENEPGAVTTTKYRRVGHGVPAINRFLHMTTQEAKMFEEMQKDGVIQIKDTYAGSITTYIITNGDDEAIAETDANASCQQ